MPLLGSLRHSSQGVGTTLWPNCNVKPSSWVDISWCGDAWVCGPSSRGFGASRWSRN